MRVQVIDGVVKPMNSRPGFAGGLLNTLGDMDLEEAQKTWTPEERKEFRRAMGIAHSLFIAVTAAAIGGGIIFYNIKSKDNTNNQNTTGEPVLVVKDTNQ